MSAASGKKDRLYKSLRTLAGGMVVLVGVIAIPYPGPGWLIVFAGLAILARDYPAAQRLLDAAQARYDTWQTWLRRQPLTIKIVFWVSTSVVVVATLWLLNAYGIINSIFNLELDWLKSPLVK